MKIFKIIFFVFGLALLGWVIQQTSISETLDLVSQIGWGFLLVLFFYFLAFLFDSLTWQITFISAPLTPKWLFRFFNMRLAGEAFNNTLPAASMGGEPVKAVLLKNHYGFNYRESAASIILARTINSVALILFLIAGVFLMLDSAVLDEKYNLIASTGLVVITVLIFLFFAVQRFKLASLTSAALSKNKFFQRLDGILHHIKDVDEKLVEFYTCHHARAAFAFVLAFVNWVLGVTEIYITMFFLGHPITMTEAWIIEAVAQLVRVATFVIPASIGAQEGAFMVIGAAVTGSPTVGFAVALVRRAREIIWIGWGMAAFYIAKPDITHIEEET